MEEINLDSKPKAFDGISKKKIVLFSFSLLFLILSLVLSLVFSSKKQSLSQKAAEKIKKPSVREIPLPKFKEGEVIVKFRSDIAAEKVVGSLEDLPESLKQTDKKYHFKNIEKVFKNVKSAKPVKKPKTDLSRTYVLTFDKKNKVEEVVADLAGNPNIQYAEPNYIYRAVVTPNDPYYLDHYPEIIQNRDPIWNPAYDYQWNLKKINAGKAWDISSGSGVIVAIIDTGVDYSHPELGGCNLQQVNEGTCPKVISGYDFVNYDNNPEDDFGHGTHVAGIIAAETNNNLGIAGIAGDSSILPIKVLDSTGSGYIDQVANGINYAVYRGSRVINLSLGGSSREIPQTLKDSLDLAFENNVVIVASAGNDNTDVSFGFWPANYKYAISVAATDENDQKAPYSNYGKIEVCAPGGSNLIIFCH